METVLLIPEYSHEIRGSVLQTAQLLMNRAARFPELKLVVPYPSEGSRWKDWSPGKWKVSSPNVEFVPVLMEKYSELALGRVSADWASGKFGGRKDYHVVVTMRCTAPNGIRRLFGKPMVGFHPDVVNLFLIGGVEYYKSLYPDLTDEALWNMRHSWNVLCGTTGFAANMLKQFTQLFSLPVVRDMKDRTVQINLGVDTDLLDTVKPMFGKDDKFRFAYGGRLNADKGCPDQLDMVRHAYAMNGNVEFGCFFVFDRTGDSKMMKVFENEPMTKIWLNQEPVNEFFWSYAKAADLFLSMSKTESTGLGFQEMLYLGVPGFFLDAPYVCGLLPDDYPYVFRTKGEMKAAVQAYATGRLKLAYDMEKMRSYIRREHSRNAFNDNVLTLLQTFAKQRREGGRPKLWADVIKSLDCTNRSISRIRGSLTR